MYHCMTWATMTKTSLVHVLDSDLFLKGQYSNMSNESFVFCDVSLTVKAAPHGCVIRTGQP